MSNVRSREVTDEPFGPADGIATAYPLKFKGYASPRVGRVSAVYCEDWRGRIRLSEKPRTNLAVRSGELTHAAWTRSNLTSVASTVVAPDGLGTMAKIVVGATTGAHYLGSTPVAGLPDHAMAAASVYVKKAELARVVLNCTYKNGSACSVEFRFDDERITSLTHGTGNSAVKVHVDKLTGGIYRLRMWNFSIGSGATLPRMSVFPSTDKGVSDDVWSKTNVTAPRGAGGVSPLAGWTFDSLIETVAANSAHYASQNLNLVKGHVYRLRAYAEETGAGAKRYLGLVLASGTAFPTNRYITVDVASGVASSYGTSSKGISNVAVIDVGNGVKLIEADLTPDNSGTSTWQLRLTKSPGSAMESYTGDGVSGLFLAAPYCWDLDASNHDTPPSLAYPVSMAGDGLSGVYAWGGQLEIEPDCTPYLATTSAAATVTDWDALAGSVHFGRPPLALAKLSWDGTVEWSERPTLLPPNASTAEIAIEGAIARVDDVPVPLRTLWNPATCPLELLPWLAWAFSIDGWNSAWHEQIKRARIQVALDIQRRKGTAQSVRQMVAAFGGNVELREWWQLQPPGPPHTFDMVLTLSGEGGQTATAQFVDDVIAEVARTKPVRSHFTFTQGLQGISGVGLIAAARTANYTRLQLQAV